MHKILRYFDLLLHIGILVLALYCIFSEGLNDSIFILAFLVALLGGFELLSAMVRSFAFMEHKKYQGLNNIYWLMVLFYLVFVAVYGYAHDGFNTDDKGIWYGLLIAFPIAPLLMYNYITIRCLMDHEL